MALEGTKGTQLERLWMNDPDRRPGYRVVIWNQRMTSVQDIVMGEWSGPALDISDWVSSVDLSLNQVFENSEDAISSNCEITVEIEKDVDIGGRRINIDERLFSDGTPIRIFEGDTRVSRNDWLPVFTGVCRGFPGSQVAIKQARRQVRIQAFGRAQGFQQQIIVGTNWGYGTDLGDMAVDIAMLELGLKREEIRFGQFGLETRHKSNALAQIQKMAGLYEIMKHVGRKPYFDAYGRLVSHDTSFDKPPIYIFDRSRIIRSIIRVQQLKSTKNSVQVIGLNSTLTKIVQPTADLSEVNVTLGYFDTHYREDIYYSSDRTRRAENTGIRVVHTGGFGGGASWEERSEFHGRLTINTKYAPWVVAAITLAWTILSIWEYGLDQYIALDPVGSKLYYATVIRLYVQLAKAATMVSLLVVMTKIGRYRLFVYGQPFEHVYEENRAIAVLKGVPTADVDELEVSMHWLYSVDLAKAAAKRLLRREVAKGQQFQIEMPSNAIFEVDDIIVIRDPDMLPNGRFWHFYINSITKSLERPATGSMTMTAWKVGETDEV